MNKKSFKKYNKRYKKTSKKFSRKIKKRIFGGNSGVINIVLNKTYIESFKTNIIELISTLIKNNIQKPKGMFSWVSYLNKSINEINNLIQSILQDIIARIPILFVSKDPLFYSCQLKTDKLSEYKTFFENFKNIDFYNNFDGTMNTYVIEPYNKLKESIADNSDKEFQIDEKLNNLNKLYLIIEATEKRFRGRIPNAVMNNFENIKNSISDFKINTKVDYLKIINPDFKYTISNSSEVNKLKQELSRKQKELLECQTMNTNIINHIHPPEYSPQSYDDSMPNYLPPTIPPLTSSLIPSTSKSTPLPSSIPSLVPSSIPSLVPSTSPSKAPSSVPSSIPSSQPSSIPS